MNKRHPYNNIIERKLEQLPGADAAHLWNDMHAILDKNMPQKKEKRRIVAWLFNDKGLLFLTTASIIAAMSSLFFLSTKENSTNSIKKIVTVSPDKFIEDEGEKISESSKENTRSANESDSKTNNNLAATAPLTSTFSHAIKNNLATKQSEKYISKNQLRQSIQATISNDKEHFHIAPFGLMTSHKDFSIATNYDKEKLSLNRQLKPVANKVKAIIRDNNKNGLYTGIISGVDLSSIHFHAARTGATKGLIIGYAFNKKWSIESGLFWDKKRVYDDGSYFKPPGYTATSGITIVAVNGKSRLYELPLNIKYTIISGKRSLFATTGLSSYFMRLENYDYEYLQNNQPGGHNYISYKNETKNWFSVVNFSIGYSQKLGDIGNIRIEPYLKLPVKNLGTGNMPIMSTGLNIGFTKPLR